MLRKRRRSHTRLALSRSEHAEVDGLTVDSVFGSPWAPYENDIDHEAVATGCVPAIKGDTS